MCLINSSVRILIIILLLGTTTTQTTIAHATFQHAENQTPNPYTFQVGALGATPNGYGDNFGIPVTGVSAQIRVRSNQTLTHPDEVLAYWVGVNLPNDSFIQVGYLIEADENGGAPSQFWEYYPPGTAAENLGYRGNVGSIVGSNGTWITFSLESLNTHWIANVNNQTIGTVDLNTTQSATTGPYAVAEAAQVLGSDSILGPVEFRNLSYRDSNLAWHQTTEGVALCCYGVQSPTLPTSQPYPYGVENVPGDNNHWLAGSGLPQTQNGQLLWPTHDVTVTPTTYEISPTTTLILTVIGTALITTLCVILTLTRRKNDSIRSTIQNRKYASYRFCWICRNQIPPNNTFCPKCGTKLA